MGILTQSEALDILRMNSSGGSSALDIALAAIDEYLKEATGHDWAADDPIDAEAKAAATMMLVQWHENPGMIGAEGTLAYGLDNVIAHLQLKAPRSAS